jgi:hypothetical protein
MNKEKSKNKQTEKKIRKLYHLETEDAIFVREYARNKGISESEVIRMSVRTLQSKVEEDPFRKVIGSVNAGPNQAVNHDEVIYE